MSSFSLALDKYLKLAGIGDKSNEFLFRKVYFHKRKNRYFLRSGNHISYTTARESLQKILADIGLKSSLYGLHSFRSGGATSAANNGVSDRLFKKHGRWKSEGANDHYVKEDEGTRKYVSSKLGM